MKACVLAATPGFSSRLAFWDLAEFDFRYNYRASLKISDRERADKLLDGIRGKRLTYRRIGEAAYA